MQLALEEDDDEWDTLTVIAQTVINNNMDALALMDENEEENKKKRKFLFRNEPRQPKKNWRHAQAHHCINRDYIGPCPLFPDRDFEMMFRVNRSRFQRLMEDVMNKSNESFYLKNTDAVGNKGASLEARLLLPLKCLAYGVPPHAFTDYFQMSKTLAKLACKTFDTTIRKIYQGEYLRLPTKDDIANIVKLHKAVHGVDGMFGSLDCMHTYWKNCPVAWQGSYQGKEKKPSIVLEAISDYHLWFWHAAYGYAGTLNDKTILNLSPFLESLIDGSFAEAEILTVPYKIEEYVFHRLFITVDGIYPPYCRFVKGMKEPLSLPEKIFTAWQESVRKDIERAFGVLQAKFQVLARPLYPIHLDRIANKVATCLILHNMCVSDRVMGDVRATYNPAASIDDIDLMVESPEELATVQASFSETHLATTGVARADEAVQELVIKREEWLTLQDEEEHIRLHEALMKLKYRQSKEK